MKSKIGEYLIQVLLIVFSVVLALALTEYINSLKTKKELNLMLKNIEEELRTNREIVEELIPYHENVLIKLKTSYSEPQKLDSIKASDDINFFNFAPKGIQQKLINKTAWETAKLSGLIHEIKNERLQLLAKTYEQQEITFTPSDKIQEIVASRDFLDNSKAKENLILLYWQFNELIGRESALKRHYDKVLKELEDEN